jgi:hypothetical protein
VRKNQRYAATISRQNIIRAGGVFGTNAGFLSFSNVWSAARLQGKSLWMKESLRQCIRPVGGDFVLLAI